MNENEKKLFYNVLKDKISEEPAPELLSNIMNMVYQKTHKRMVIHKILEISGYSFLIIFAFVFVGVYLFYYSGFKLPTWNFSFVMPSRIYIVIFSIIFAFSLVDLFFRKRLYENV